LPFYSEWLELLGNQQYLGIHFNKFGERLKYVFDYVRVILSPQYEDRKFYVTPLPRQFKFAYVLARIFRFVKYWTYTHHVNKRRGMIH
jgi:hypothetical protein